MKKLLCAFALFASFQTHSAIIDLLEYDYLDAGDNLITYDRYTGIQWLDVTHSRGMSILDIEASGIMNDGWEWATIQQLTTLLTHTGVYFDGRTGLNPVEADGQLLSLLGATHSTNGTFGSVDFTDSYLLGVSREFTHGFDSTGDTPFSTFQLRYTAYSGAPSGHCSFGDRCFSTPENDGFAHRWHDENWSNQTAGGMLVRAVPEPSSLVLLGFGIAGLLLIRKTNQQER